MSYTIKKLNPTEIELTITVEPAGYQKHLAPAADRLSRRTAIKGFRPGKTPYEVIRRELGEMAIFQEALEAILPESFYQAVKAEGLETIGQPAIHVDKLAPGNELVYKATVSLIPKVQLADPEKITVKKEVAAIETSQVEETLQALRGLRAEESPKAGPAAGQDKLVLDLDMFLDRVPVEGGQAKNYQVYLGEDHYVPGFNAQVAGLKPHEEKTFTLNFPSAHYQKMLAGKAVEFKVKVKEVYERRLPELSDAFAGKLGQESIEKLRALIQKNLEHEARGKADQKAEIEILEAMINQSIFDPIPAVLLDAEKQKMFFELKRDLDRHGVSIEQYLEDLKKTEAELRRDFAAQAEKRAKAALLSRQIAQEQNLKVSDEELKKEVELMREVYQNDQTALENLHRPEVRESIATTLQNKKVMAWLKEKILPNK